MSQDIFEGTEQPKPSEPSKTKKISTDVTWGRLQRMLHRPVSFYPLFARISGGVTAGIFLSQAFYWSTRTNDPDGWFYKTQDEWFQETELTRREQETARRKLKNHGFLEERLQGIPARLYYRLRKENVLEAILAFTNCETDETMPPETPSSENDAPKAPRRKSSGGSSKSAPPRPAGEAADASGDARASSKTKAKSQFGGKRHTRLPADESVWRIPPNKDGASRHTGLAPSAKHSIFTESTTESTPPTGGGAAGAGGGDAHALKTAPSAIDAIVEQLYAHATGLSRSVLRRLVTANPDHAALWAQHWPAERESRDSYWEGREDRRAGALRIRLSDADRLPAALLARQRAIKRREAQEHTREQNQAATRQQTAKTAQRDAELHQKLRETWEEYAQRGEMQRQAIDAAVSAEAPLVAQRVRERGGIMGLDSGSVLWRDFMGAVGRVLADMREIEEEADAIADDEPEPEIDTAAIIAAQIERFVAAGGVHWEDWMAFDDTQKNHIETEVARRLRQ